MPARNYFPRTVRLTALCTLLLAPNVLAQSTPDYTTIPADPHEIEQKLTAAHITLAQAVAAAEKATNGHSLEAKAMTAGDHLRYEIIVSSLGMEKRVVVDGTTGAVTAAMLTIPAAIEKATATTTGTVRSVIFDMRADPPTAVVMLYHEGKAHKVVLNANDGSLISDEAQGRFPGVATDGEMQELPSGLRFIELTEGTGKSPESPNSKVKVHYTGYLTDGTKIDSSVDRGQPAEFFLGGVIKGWTEGVGLMKIGGKRKLIIPAELAWGDRGRAPAVPPKAAVIFDIELIAADETPPNPAPTPAVEPRTPGASGTVQPKAAETGKPQG